MFVRDIQVRLGAWINSGCFRQTGLDSRGERLADIKKGRFPGAEFEQKRNTGQNTNLSIWLGRNFSQITVSVSDKYDCKINS